MQIFELFGKISLPGIDKVNGQLQGLQGKVQKLAPALRKIGMGMTVAGGAIVGGFALSMKAAADFESAMRSVNTMMGLSENEFTDFSKDVQTLASRLGVDAVDSANALYQAISAGVPKENVLEFLEIATKAAIGGITSTETAVDGLTTVLNAFKLPMSDAQKVADIMFTTVKGGKTTFEELSASMFNVAPLAAAMGVGFDEVSAALATMTKQGTPTAQATTQLRQVMVGLQKPTKEMSEAIEDLGFESGRAMLKELGLAGTLDKLSEFSAKTATPIDTLFGSVEAGAAIFTLTGDSASMFAESLEEMTNATGAATDAFDEMEKGATRQMEALKNSFKDIQISIGNVLLPILKDIVDSVKPIIENIKNWMAENPGLTKTIVIIVGAIGGLLLVLGPILIMLPGIIAFLPILGAAFAALMGPVGLIIAAIAALIAIGILVWKNWDKISDMAKKIWGGITKFFKETWKKIVGFFSEHWDKILAILFPAVGLPILIARNWGAIVGVVKDIWNDVMEWFKGVPQRIGNIFAKVKDFILAPFRAAWAGIAEGINWLIRQINKIKVPEIKVAGVVIFGGWKGLNIPPISLPKFEHGGLITEPTILYGLRSQRPYAIAGEAGIEHVGPGAGGASITVNIIEPHVRNDRDIDLMGDRLVARLRQMGVTL